MWLKQSTNTTVKFGPFLDQADGFTPETSLTISQADIRLTKNGGDFAQTNNATGATHDENGYYDIPLDTTDTNTLGMLRVAVNESGALPVWQDFMVVPANVWDSLFGADRLQVHTAEISNDLITSDVLAASAISEIQSGLATSTALATAQSDLDLITGTDGATLATAQANYAPAKAGDEMDLVDAPNGTAITAIQNGLATPTNITAGTITTVTNLTNAPTNGDFTATMKASVNAEVDAAIETYHLDHLLAATYDPASKPGAADALLNELVSNDSGVSQFTANALELAPTGGSAPTVEQIRQEIDTNSTQLAAIVEDTGTTIPGQISGLNNLSAAQVNSEVDTALADYDAPTYTELLNLFRLALRKDSAIATDLSALITAINSDLASGGGTFANTTDAIEAIRDRGDAAWITATGFSTLDAVGVRSAIGLATANLDTQLDAIPTAGENASQVRTELTTELGRIDVATSSRSNHTAANVRTEMDSNSTQLAAIVADTNELQADWVNGGRLDNILDARASQASVDIIDDFLDTEIAAILADTNELQTDWANGGRLDLILDSAAAGASPAAVADAVWDEALSGHATAGSTGEALSNAGSAGDPWATSLPGAYGAGTAGKIIGDNINATVSSRSSHSAADVWAAGTRTLTSFGTLIADIWAYATRTLSSFGSLVSDIWANGTRTITGGTVTTNSDKTGYSISGTKTTLDALNDVSAAQVNSEVDAALTDIHLDHLLAADYDPASKPGASTALLNELIGNDSGVSQFTANALELGPGGVTAAAIADAVLEELLADHDDTSGSLAEAITLVRKLLQNRVAHSGTTITVYDDDSTTPLLTRTPKDKNGTAINSSSYDANIPAEVTRAA